LYHCLKSFVLLLVVFPLSVILKSFLPVHGEFLIKPGSDGYKPIVA